MRAYTTKSTRFAAFAKSVAVCKECLVEVPRLFGQVAVTCKLICVGLPAVAEPGTGDYGSSYPGSAGEPRQH